MKYLVFVFTILFTINSYAQVPLYGTQRSEGYQCPIQSLTNTDSTAISEVLYWRPDAKLFTGAASLVGFMKLTAGTDTLVTFYMRLVMHSDPIILTNSVLYDSTDWRELKAQTGDYIPAENAVDGTGVPISINLANQDHWMPSVGVQIKALMCYGAVRTKQLELYVVTTRESK